MVQNRGRPTPGPPSMPARVGGAAPGRVRRLTRALRACWLPLPRPRPSGGERAAAGDAARTAVRGAARGGCRVLRWSAAAAPQPPPRPRGGSRGSRAGRRGAAVRRRAERVPAAGSGTGRRPAVAGGGRPRARCSPPATPPRPAAPGARHGGPPVPAETAWSGGAPGAPGAPGGRRPAEVDRPGPAPRPTADRRPSTAQQEDQHGPGGEQGDAASRPDQATPALPPTSRQQPPGPLRGPAHAHPALRPRRADVPEAARCLAMARLRLARKCPGKSSSALVKLGTEAAIAVVLEQVHRRLEAGVDRPAVRADPRLGQDRQHRGDAHQPRRGAARGGGRRQQAHDLAPLGQHRAARPSRAGARQPAWPRRGRPPRRARSS